MTAVRAVCWVCMDPEGLMYAIRDIAKPGEANIGELGLCDRCRDLLATGWASVLPLGVKELAR